MKIFIKIIKKGDCMRKKHLIQIDEFINYMDEIIDVDNWNSTLKTFDHKVDIMNRKENGERYALIRNDKNYEKNNKRLKKHLIKEYHTIPNLNQFTAAFYNEYQDEATNEKLEYYLKAICYVFTKEKNKLKKTESMDSENYLRLFDFYTQNISGILESELHEKQNDEKWDLVNASLLGIDIALSTIYEDNIGLNENPYVSYYYDLGIRGVDLFDFAETAELLSDYAYRTYPKYFHLYITPKDISLMSTPLFLNIDDLKEKKLLMSFSCFLATKLEYLMVVREHQNIYYMTDLPNYDDLMRQCDLFFHSSFCHQEFNYDNYELIIDYSTDIYETLMTIWTRKMEQIEAKKVYKEKSKIYR